MIDVTKFHRGNVWRIALLPSRDLAAQPQQGRVPRGTPVPKMEWVVTLRSPIEIPNEPPVIVVLHCWQLAEGSTWKGHGAGVALHGPEDLPRQDRSLGVDCRRPYTVPLARFRDDQWYGPITTRKMLEIELAMWGDGEGSGGLQMGDYRHLPGT